MVALMLPAFFAVLGVIGSYGYFDEGKNAMVFLIAFCSIGLIVLFIKDVLKGKFK